MASSKKSHEGPAGSHSMAAKLRRGSLTVGYQKKVPAGRIKPAFFVSNFWFLSIVFYCNVL